MGLHAELGDFVASSFMLCRSCRDLSFGSLELACHLGSPRIASPIRVGPGLLILVTGSGQNGLNTRQQQTTATMWGSIQSAGLGLGKRSQGIGSHSPS